MATNISPCKGSYVLNQFPSNVMFGMNGFHVSASGAIQGHHGPLVVCPNIMNFSNLSIKPTQVIKVCCLHYALNLFHYKSLSLGTELSCCIKPQLSYCPTM